jgi:glycerol uptake facilitator protein
MWPGNYGNVSDSFWIPIVAPLIGAAIAAFLYDALIRDILMARGENPDPGVRERGRTVVDEG